MLRRTTALPSSRIDPARVEGFPAVTLMAGALEATFVAAAGMVCASLRHHGDELLDARNGVREYVEMGATMGIPFLHPWANRLSADTYEVAGRRVGLPPYLPREEHGLPIHGVLPRSFAIASAGVGQHRAHAVATLDFEEAAFPFRHRVEQRIALDRKTLVIQTMLTATGASAVPVSFGFHPYLRLPGVPRAEWTLSLPARRRLLTDYRLIPSGATVREPAEEALLGTRRFDDGYDELGPSPRLAIAGGGRRIAVSLLAGYPVAQVFAPSESDVVCLEPMTAPTNALVTGDGLRLIEPGRSFGAAFEVRVE